MILVIDTTDVERIFLGLIKGEEFTKTKNLDAKYQHAEKLLPAIQVLLKTKSYQALPAGRQGKAIAVISGPGSFTSLRIGVVTANALAYAQRLPIIGISKEEFTDLPSLAAVISKKLKHARVGGLVEPAYGKEPNITIKKQYA